MKNAARLPQKRITETQRERHSDRRERGGRGGCRDAGKQTDTGTERMIARARHGPRPARPVHPCAGP